MEKSELETSVENSRLKPIGIITERDIIQFQILELNLGKIQAQTLMSTPLFLVSPSEDKTFHRQNQNATFLSYSHPTDFCFTTQESRSATRKAPPLFLATPAVFHTLSAHSYVSMPDP